MSSLLLLHDDKEPSEVHGASSLLSSSLVLPSSTASGVPFVMGGSLSLPGGPTFVVFGVDCAAGGSVPFTGDPSSNVKLSFFPLFSYSDGKSRHTHTHYLHVYSELVSVAFW